MNTVMLQKCLDELNKETFSKEYVKGVLETLMALDGLQTIKSVTGGINLTTPPVASYTPQDEEFDPTLAAYLNGPAPKQIA